jgi:3-methyladenine DNA glycosylase/8-oxoguanine DNA glycosylase
MQRADVARSRFSIAVPANFSFLRTVLSHGWDRTLELRDGTIVACTLEGRDHAIDVNVKSRKKLKAAQQSEIVAQLCTILRLDEDLSPFYRESKKHPEFRWILRSGAGRMLRAPSVFEDVVKMICTTNCTWALTTLMVTNLVRMYGNSQADSPATFPTPEALAGSSDRVLRNEIKSGYRSPFLLGFAERVASKQLDPESWRSSPLSTEELFTQMRAVKGIGPYAAGNIMKLVGRYDYLGLDSWVRSRYSSLHHKGRTVKDSTIERRYAPYGTWRGLFFWLEMTRYWHDEKFFL